MHGRAVPLDLTAPEAAGFRQTVLEIYLPRYGPQWETEFLDAGPVYARIDADKMFTFQMVGEGGRAEIRARAEAAWLSGRPLPAPATAVQSRAAAGRGPS